MHNPEIIVIGTSAGGLAALQELLGNLPVDFKTPIFIVQHNAAHTHSYLPEILSQNGMLPASHPQDGQLIEQGNVYVAPPDHHLIVEGGRILVKKGPKENRFRPCIDTLFRSAAYAYGNAVIGVILTGMLDDGSSGMWSIQRMGGTTIVQSPQEAAYPSMPLSVLQYIEPDYTVPLAQMSSLLAELTFKPMKNQLAIDEQQMKLMKTEIQIASERNGFERGIMQMGEPSNLTCPDCGGAMVRLKEGALTRYRCHTGHGFSSGSLIEEVKETIEKTLWQAVRSFEEMVMLLQQTAGPLEVDKDQTDDADAIGDIQHATKYANALRGVIFGYLSESANRGDLKAGIDTK